MISADGVVRQRCPVRYIDFHAGGCPTTALSDFVLAARVAGSLGVGQDRIGYYHRDVFDSSRGGRPSPLVARDRMGAS